MIFRSLFIKTIAPIFGGIWMVLLLSGGLDILQGTDFSILDQNIYIFPKGEGFHY